MYKHQRSHELLTSSESCSTKLNVMFKLIAMPFRGIRRGVVGLMCAVGKLKRVCTQRNELDTLAKQLQDTKTSLERSKQKTSLLETQISEQDDLITLLRKQKAEHHSTSNLDLGSIEKQLHDAETSLQRSTQRNSLLETQVSAQTDVIIGLRKQVGELSGEVINLKKQLRRGIGEEH